MAVTNGNPTIDQLCGRSATFAQQLPNYQITESPNSPPSSFLDSLYARADPADDFPRNGADRRGHFSRVDLIAILRADDHDLVTGRDLHAGDVDHDHVHADRSDDWGATAANQDVAA